MLNIKLNWLVSLIILKMESTEKPVIKRDKNSNKKEPLNKYYGEAKYEIGIDEAGRGPMFGRVYVSAVILPKDDSFDHSKMKDSKRFHSKKKIKEVAEYIQNNALYWTVQYMEHNEIDKLNIREATIHCMHKCINDIIKQINENNIDFNNYYLIVDGNDFKPYCRLVNNKLLNMKYICIEGGDNLYTSIAAASILSKVHRDDYIDEMCEKYPLLDEYYSLRTNKGYGTAKHIEGINEHSISPWHRKTYGLCKSQQINTNFNI